jgi:hypothetical protein
VHLVFLALEPAEEAADAFVITIAIDDEAALFLRELGPRRLEADVCLAGRPLQLGQLGAIVRLAPRLDRSLRDRFRRIGHDEVHVELDDVAEAVTRRTGAERVVEREEPRLRRLVRDATRAAFESLRELEAFGLAVEHDGKRGAAALSIRRLDRISEPRAQVAFDAQAIDDHFELRS